MSHTVTSARGLLLAGATAAVSGVSVYVNSFGVADFSSPAVYTTAKNLVAALLLGAATLSATRSAHRRSARPISVSASEPARRGLLGWLALAYVGIVGGGVAFILFFTGLSTSPPAAAAFLRDTLLVFVALLAWPLLGERVKALNVAALGVLVGGEVAVAGGVGSFGHGDGPVLVLVSTVLWAIEAVLARWLLAGTRPAVLATTRMGVGVAALLGYLAIDGRLGQLFSLNLHQWGWAIACGGLLTLYVATWFAALARARALDVSSVLVGSVLVTALLQRVDGRSFSALALVGLGLVALGVGAVFGIERGGATA